MLRNETPAVLAEPAAGSGLTSPDDLHVADGDGAVRPQHDLPGVVARLLALTEREWGQVPGRRDHGLTVPHPAREAADFSSWGAVNTARWLRVSAIDRTAPDSRAVEVREEGVAAGHGDATEDCAPHRAALAEGVPVALERDVDEVRTLPDDGRGDDRRTLYVRPWREAEPWPIRPADELLTRGGTHV